MAAIRTTEEIAKEETSAPGCDAIKTIDLYRLFEDNKTDTYKCRKFFLHALRNPPNTVFTNIELAIVMVVQEKNDTSLIPIMECLLTIAEHNSCKLDFTDMFLNAEAGYMFVRDKFSPEIMQKLIKLGALPPPPEKSPFSQPKSVKTPHGFIQLTMSASELGMLHKLHKENKISDTQFRQILKLCKFPDICDITDFCDFWSELLRMDFEIA